MKKRGIRRRSREGSETRAVAKNNNTEKDLSAKRKINYASLQAAGDTWSWRAEAAGAITHRVAHPTRGPLSGFFRGGGCECVPGEVLLTALLLGIPPIPSAGPGSRSHGGPRFPVCPSSSPLVRLRDASGATPKTIPRKWDSSASTRAGDSAFLLFLLSSSPSPGPAEEAAHRGTKRGGMKWEGPDRWDPRAEGVGLGTTLEPLGRKRGWKLG